MFKKLILLIISFNLLLQCGFTPMYSIKSGNINNVSINEIMLTGDKTINNYMETNFIRYKNNKNENTFNLNIDTKFYKKTLTKDKTAEVTDYRLSSISTIEISLNKELITASLLSLIFLNLTMHFGISFVRGLRRVP